MLRLDIVKHFPSVDHAILFEILSRTIRDADVLWLVDKIIASGAGVLDDEYMMEWFLGDDLFATVRPRGLPIGKPYFAVLVQLLSRSLRPFCETGIALRGLCALCGRLWLFSDSKRELWRWKQATVERLASLRLKIHPEAQMAPVSNGIPWLGFLVYPDHRGIKARKVRGFSRKLKGRWIKFCSGAITFAEFDATVQGWINHVRYADTWELRRCILGRPLKRQAG